MQYVTLKYVQYSNATSDAILDLHAYYMALLQFGFLLRIGTALSRTPTEAIMRGYLGAPSALEQSKRHQCTQLLFDAVHTQFESIEQVAETELIASGREYCYHSEWKTLTLVNEPLLGLAPLMHPQCGGAVALFRITQDADLIRRIWSWDMQYYHLFNLWLLSCEYEDWAESQLASEESIINQTGRLIAGELSRQTNVMIEYERFEPGR